MPHLVDDAALDRANTLTATSLQFSYFAGPMAAGFKGACLKDPARLFNSSLDPNTRRAIDIHEGEEVDARAFKALVKAAAAQNRPPAKKR
jgi:hypothetical protein